MGANDRWAGEWITANAVHPGAILDTNLGRHMDPEAIQQLASRSSDRLKSIPQGAATSVLVATSPQLEGVGGRYFEDCNEAEPFEPDGETRPAGVASYALDHEAADRLWELSLELVG